MPLYAKPNSIIAYGNFTRNFAYDYVTDAKLVIYGLEDGKTAECRIYDKEANLALVVKAERKGDVITVTADREAKFTVESAQGLRIEM